MGCTKTSSKIDLILKFYQFTDNVDSTRSKRITSLPDELLFFGEGNILIFHRKSQTCSDINFSFKITRKHKALGFGLTLVHKIQHFTQLCRTLVCNIDRC